MTKVTELVADVVTPLAEARGDELVDVEYVKEKKQYYLRIYVDRRPGGIDIEEIANLSELVSEKLDELDPDPFPEPYILELSSPGLERPIKNIGSAPKDHTFMLVFIKKLMGKRLMKVL